MTHLQRVIFQFLLVCVCVYGITCWRGEEEEERWREGEIDGCRMRVTQNGKEGL